MAEPSDTGSSSRRISWGARLLAPLALVLALLAIYLVVTGSMGIDDDSSDEPATTNEKSGKDGEGPETPKTYLVEDGDSLGTIAEEFGVSVKRLERLNPDIDPQTLNPGQEITLR